MCQQTNKKKAWVLNVVEKSKRNRNYVDFVMMLNVSICWTIFLKGKNQDWPKIYVNLKTISSTEPKLSRNNSYVFWALLRIEKKKPTQLFYYAHITLSFSFEVGEEQKEGERES